MRHGGALDISDVDQLIGGQVHSGAHRTGPRGSLANGWKIHDCKNPSDALAVNSVIAQKRVRANVPLACLKLKLALA